MTLRESLSAVNLAVLVPCLIVDLAADGGPTEGDYAWLRGYAEDRGVACPDDLPQQTGGPGPADVLFNDVARAVSIMAFRPGGYTVLGLHFAAPARLAR